MGRLDPGKRGRERLRDYGHRPGTGVPVSPRTRHPKKDVELMTADRDVSDTFNRYYGKVVKEILA